jgi:hypothetical protein
LEDPRLTISDNNNGIRKTVNTGIITSKNVNLEKPFINAGRRKGNKKAIEKFVSIIETTVYSISLFKSRIIIGEAIAVGAIAVI